VTGQRHNAISIAAWIILTIVVACAAPLALGEVGQAVLVRMLIAAVFATSFALLIGQAGLLSFGHAAFFGLGALATMQLMIATERGTVAFPAPLLPLFGGLVGSVVAASMAVVAARRSGTYFALVTLAIAELIQVAAIQWKGAFGGEAGLTSMRMPWGSISFDTSLQVYYFTLVWTVIAIVLAWGFTKTVFGQIAKGIRENDERLKFLGYNTYLSKIVVFSFSGFLSGIAGGLFAFSSESATYALLSSHVSLEVVFQTFIGGTSFFFAPAAAAAAMTGVPFILSKFTRLWPVYQGLLFMIVMYYSPLGIAGLLSGRNANDRSRSFRIAARSAAGLLLLVCGFVFAAESLYCVANEPNAAYLAALGRNWARFVAPLDVNLVSGALACAIGGIAMALGWRLLRIAKPKLPLNAAPYSACEG
jgi:branched-chain amino acid transport system permease protein